MVVADRFKYICQFEARHTICTEVQLAELSPKVCWRHHGLPAETVSDRVSRFTAKFWSASWQWTGTNLALTAYHSQTDGQKERAERTRQQMRIFLVTKQLGRNVAVQQVRV